jgi:sRNA-binding regulator protein Hfq
MIPNPDTSKTRPVPNDMEESVTNHRFQTIYRGQIDNFGKHLIGKVLSVELTNGKMITGKLRSFGQFDVMIIDQRTGQSIIIMKHAILTVQGDLEPRKEGSQ